MVWVTKMARQAGSEPMMKAQRGGAGGGCAWGNSGGEAVGSSNHTSESYACFESVGDEVIPPQLPLLV